MSTFSDKIRELRKQKGVSQAVVAEYLGITKQAYSLYETGKRVKVGFALFGDTEIDDDVLDDVKRLAKLHLELRRSKEKDSEK